MRDTGIAYSAEALRYVGIAFLSGSIVHAGTLGGNSAWYIGVFCTGIGLFIAGTHLSGTTAELNLRQIMLAILFSIGIGMLSGGLQHFFEGPAFAAAIIPVGFVLSYCSFRARTQNPEVKETGAIIVGALLLFGILTVYAGNLEALPHGHGTESLHD